VTMCHALPSRAFRYEGSGGHQRLALAGAHLRDLALVQRDAAHQLHVEVAHAEHALARLANHGEGLGQDRVERRAGGVFCFSSGVLAASSASVSFAIDGSSALMSSTSLRYCLSRRSLRLPKMALRAVVSTGSGF